MIWGVVRASPRSTAVVLMYLSDVYLAGSALSLYGIKIMLPRVVMI